MNGKKYTVQNYSSGKYESCPQMSILILVHNTIKSPKVSCTTDGSLEISVTGELLYGNMIFRDLLNGKMCENSNMPVNLIA